MATCEYSFRMDELPSDSVIITQVQTLGDIEFALPGGQRDRYVYLGKGRLSTYRASGDLYPGWDFKSEQSAQVPDARYGVDAPDYVQSLDDYEVEEYIRHTCSWDSNGHSMHSASIYRIDGGRLHSVASRGD